MKALPAHVAADHIHKRFDNEFSEQDQVTALLDYCYFWSIQTIFFHLQNIFIFPLLLLCVVFCSLGAPLAFPTSDMYGRTQGHEGAKGKNCRG